jgi:nucleotide-binding universal stress UspA family protein
MKHKTNRIRRILHPSDFSPASQRAFIRAVNMAKESAAELLLVHVLTPVVPLVGESYVSSQTYSELERSVREAAQTQLGALVTRARKKGIRAQGLVLMGVRDVEIVRAARSKGADTIVMGTHGRSGLAKFFLGSVAARVVATARCPVVTIGVRVPRAA